MRCVNIAFHTPSSNSWRRSGTNIEKKSNPSLNSLVEKPFYHDSIQQTNNKFQRNTHSSWRPRIFLQKIIHPCTINASPRVKYPSSRFFDLRLSSLGICAKMVTALIINLRTQTTNIFLLNKAAWTWTRTEISYCC